MIDAINAYGSYQVMAQLFVYDDTYKPTITGPAAGALPTGYVNSAYSQYIGVTSKTAEEATLTVTSGSLPDGLSLRRRGSYYIEGTPTRADTFNFTLRLENPVGFDEKEYTIEVKDEIIRPTITKKPEGVYAPNGAYLRRARIPQKTPFCFSYTKTVLPKKPPTLRASTTSATDFR